MAHGPAWVCVAVIATRSGMNAKPRAMRVQVSSCRPHTSTVIQHVSSTANARTVSGSWTPALGSVLAANPAIRVPEGGEISTTAAPARTAACRGWVLLTPLRQILSAQTV
jgi:hypothetical protein